jgi:tRNA G18 (ribose-2'-O)-methylase SpoU
MLVYNVAKKANIGTIMRSCAAFNCREMLFIGNKKRLNTFGNKGSKNYVAVTCYESIDDAVAALKEDGFSIIGVEIGNGAASVISHPFQAKTCFIMGNEGSGMTDKAKSVCDSFVYIPHYGNGIGSLNVAVAASIILQHFGAYAGFAETEWEGEKMKIDKEKQIWKKFKKNEEEDVASAEEEAKQKESSTSS